MNDRLTVMMIKTTTNQNCKDSNTVIELVLTDLT